MDHGATQSTGEVAPTNPMQELVSGMLSESQDNPNAWTDEQPEAPPQEEEAAPQETQSEGEQPTPEEDPLEEVEFEGKQYQVPVEIKRGLLREADYTRKTQEVASERKQVHAERAQLQQMLPVIEQLAPQLGQLSALDGQIASLQQQLSHDLRINDPVQYGLIANDLMMARQNRDQFVQHIGNVRGQLVQAFNAHQTQAAQARMQREMPILQAAVKDFTPEVHGKQVADYLKKSGLPDEALSYLDTSPAALALAWKAREYDRIQADKTTAQKRVEKLPPVAKPGQRVSSAQADTDFNKLREANRKAGGKDPNLRRAVLRQQLFGK